MWEMFSMIWCRTPIFLSAANMKTKKYRTVNFTVVFCECGTCWCHVMDIGCHSSRIGFWGRYFSRRGSKEKGLKKKQNEKFLDVLPSPNILEVIKSRKMKHAKTVSPTEGTEIVSPTGEQKLCHLQGVTEMSTEVWWETMKERTSRNI